MSTEPNQEPTEEVSKDQSEFDFELGERPEATERCSGEVCESCQ